MTSETTTPVTYRSGELTIPERLRPFAEPALIAGENREDYELLRQLLVNLEWLWLFDLAELSWEILRYRKLKIRAIEMHRVKAIEALLLQIDGAGFPDNDLVLRRYAGISAAEWQTDESVAVRIEARLAKHGFVKEVISAAAFLQAHTAVVLLDTLLQKVQSRRMELFDKVVHSNRFHVPNFVEQPASRAYRRSADAKFGSSAR